MVRSLLLALGASLATGPHLVAAVGSGDAEAMYNSFNNAFLVRSGNDVYYKAALNDGNPDKTWTASLDIMGAQDAYERTGDPSKKQLVDQLLTTWLKKTPPPWDWDGWNDDIGWFTMALARGYLMTGNAEFLKQARYGFDYAFGRGWDTQYNNGGIWEENPEYCARYNPPKVPAKEALSNNSLGKVACLLYQATGEQGYRDKCRQIYDWVWDHIYNPSTGQIYNTIHMDGSLNTDKQAYNQGTWLDYANLLWSVTLDKNIYRDAKKAIDFARDQITVNGIFSNGNEGLNTWADEVARGAGHFVRDNGLWDEYWGWLVQNADAIVANRDPTYGLTWNAWDKKTSTATKPIANKFVSAMAWMQYAPAAKPGVVGGVVGGIHTITNQKTGLLVDNSGRFADDTKMMQWGKGGDDNLNQHWLFTQNSADGSWNIVSLQSWKALDCPRSGKDNGLQMVQWRPTRDGNQRWFVDRLDDGSYRIWNKDSSASLDGASNSTNGAPLMQWEWNGGAQQRWILG